MRFARILSQLGYASRPSVKLYEPFSITFRHRLIRCPFEEQRRRRLHLLTSLENVGRARFFLAGFAAKVGQMTLCQLLVSPPLPETVATGRVDHRPAHDHV